jgi:hypothetical protein
MRSPRVSVHAHTSDGTVNTFSISPATTVQELKRMIENKVRLAKNSPKRVENMILKANPVLDLPKHADANLIKSSNHKRGTNM